MKFTVGSIDSGTARVDEEENLDGAREVYSNEVKVNQNFLQR
jgi:hypothetical protein